MEPLQHFSHPEHPLVFNQDERSGESCFGCREPVFGPSYSCVKCVDFKYWHHKSCAELPLGLHHPLHPLHSLILCDEWNYEDDKEFSKCKICKENKREYSYRCSHCDFNLHIRCASLLPTLEVEFHDHPLTPIWKWITFTCDLCGKNEDKGMPYMCNTCGFWIHRRCAYNFSRRVKVVRHKHPLHITLSSLELHEYNTRFCQICVQKVDTRYGLYYCSKCNFVAHLDCAMVKENKEDINLEELNDEEDEDLELDQSIDSTTAYKVKNIKVGEDGTEIATEIEHFSHEHDLKLIEEEVHNNEKCDGCVRAILPPFYSCAKCSFILHKSCTELPRKKRHPLHRHPLTLLPKPPNNRRMFWCNACSLPKLPDLLCNGFSYNCKTCDFDLDVLCSLTSDILTHKGHVHQLHLSNTNYSQSCSSCGSKRNQVFRCTTCEFALDFKCATLPHTIRYKQHEHPFTLSYTLEDDSGEYYCDICEEERNLNHWFYYCADCNYPAHPQCIMGKYSNCKSGVASTFDCHPHPLTFIEETKDHHQCHNCGNPCETFIYQCAQCNFYMHKYCL